jgi:AcrR family transcriptional regulator
MIETAYNNPEKKCFVQKVLPLFMRCGIRSLTMDDIAKLLGVSKKTIYKHVDNKDTLVEECLHEMLDSQDENIKKILEENYSAIEEHFNISAMILRSIKEVHPSVIFDLEKYYPAIFRKVLDTRTEMTYETLVQNIYKGVSEGVYRENFNPEYVARIYVGALNALFDPNVFPPDQTNFKESYKELVMLYMHSIVNENGKQVIVEKERLLSEHLNPTSL